ITLVLIYFIPLPAGGALFSTMLILSTILAIWVSHIFDIDRKRIYSFIINVAIAESIIFVLYMKFITS
ncbi:MAG TPA: hypothetical protein PLA74_04530, partial [Syntrophales bacterium]|nr:hypothetical protein [Syntrophales bacterium]